MYGGVSAIELGCAGIVRHAIAVDPLDLERRVVLAYTGEPRNSGINNWEVTKAHIDGSTRVRRNFQTIAAIAMAMRSALEKTDWDRDGSPVARRMVASANECAWNFDAADRQSDREDASFGRTSREGLRSGWRRLRAVPDGAGSSRESRSHRDARRRNGADGSSSHEKACA